jgi:starch-binding outer membrane protein, SusD/RagB family
MKKIQIIFYMLTALFMAGCTKLTVNVDSQYTTANFPTNAASYAAAIGPIYTQLSYSQQGFSFAIEYWRMQEFSSDEAIIPARGGNYDDGGQYRQLHLHTWNPDHTNVVSTWGWGFSGIGQCNTLLNLFAKAPASSTKPAAIAEVTAMRSLYYYFMMDLYGNIPIIDSFPVAGNPPTAKRADVFNFIEKSLKSALPNLSAATGAATYGHATKWMAFALLEKMYLNAEYYTGTPRYTEAVAMADSILTNGTYTLSPSFAALFAPTNGPATPETIMAVPYDPNLIPGQQFGRFGYLPFLQGKYGLPFRSSIAMSTIPDYYNNNFKQFPNDARDSLWLVGKQYNFDGSPVIVATTQKNLDATYTGTDFNVNWQLEITPNLTLLIPATMDLGNDILAQCKGIRSIKYYPDPLTNSNTRYAGNDVPLLRLADVIMMKAEAILRGAAPTTVKGELQTALVLFNKIRARSKATLATTVTLDDILPERAREFSWEAWRRNDLIRFGKFETDWGFKTAAATAVNPTPQTQPSRRIYPVPTTELALNPKLVQNPGY